METRSPILVDGYRMITTEDIQFKAWRDDDRRAVRYSSTLELQSLLQLDFQELCAYFNQDGLKKAMREKK